ncbi:MAG: hypothetical protein JWN74_814 [Acidobacteriaceae bacterium]|nr:hypothetical protein [Acidobacteriaceae bacterium]
MVKPMLNRFDKQVSHQAVQSLSLLGWSIYEPGRAPSLDYLLKRRSANPFGMDQDSTAPESDATWNALLDAYGFLTMDEFDLALLDGIRNGFFDRHLVEQRGLELDKRFKAAALDSSFQRAWATYHDSFDENQQEVLDAVYQSFIDDVQNITPLNLSGTITLFKELGRPDIAAEILRLYVASRGSDRELFNLKGYQIFGDLKDTDVIKAFADKYASYPQDKGNPETILLRMAEMNGWNPEDIKTLANLTVDEYYQLLKKTKGRDLHRILATCLQFDNIGNASDEMRAISRLAKDALRRIGRESNINALRVKRYGIDVSQVEHPDLPADESQAADS